MPVTTYASLAQFFQYGLPETVLGARPMADVQSALDAASAKMDSYFNGRYNMPLLTVSLDVAIVCCHLAAFLFMSGDRGYNPDAGADVNIKARYVEAIEWCDRVQRRALHPIITDSGPLSTLLQPIVLSSSVTNVATGHRCATRGW